MMGLLFASADHCISEPDLHNHPYWVQKRNIYHFKRPILALLVSFIIL